MTDNEGTTGGRPTSTPNPDPTLLTTQALFREVSALQELIEQKIRSVEITAASDAAHLQHQLALLIAQREEEFRNLRSLLDSHVSAAEALTDEKFRGIALQFTERDTRSERESRDNKVAVDAAFAAQKEAAAKQEETFSKGIDKSEAATQETINKLAELFRTTTDAIGDKLDDLKDRVGEIDKKANGLDVRRAGAKDDRTGLYAALGAVAVVITIIIAVASVIGGGP